MEILVHFKNGKKAVYTTAVWELFITDDGVDYICDAETGELLWDSSQPLELIDEDLPVFYIDWIRDHKRYGGYIKAVDRHDAAMRAEKILHSDCSISAVIPAYEHQVNAQSLTLNFVYQAKDVCR